MEKALRKALRRVARFAKCSRCETLRWQIEACLTAWRDIREFRRQESAHVDLVQEEKREYKKKRENAIIHPGEYCSIILDGADQ